jgi:hypothetical protein
MGSLLKYSDLASGRGLGGGRGGRDGCEGWTGGGGTLRAPERPYGLAVGCLGGGGARILFLSSDIVGAKRGVNAVSWTSASPSGVTSSAS